MSTIAVIGSNGRAAKAIIDELVSRGHDVTGFARGADNHSTAQEYVSKDLFDLNKADLAPFEVVINAFGAWTPETLDLHTKASMHLADILSGTKTRLLVVGGAGSLYVSDKHDVQLFETADFPKEYYPLAKAQAQALEALRERSDVEWTFISPAADFQAEGERTGRYIRAGEEFTLNSDGESVISYADYAIGFVDEIESGHHLKERISLLGR
ncbi:NAD(P)-dependent oxidoreductase [Streptococcus sp. zg-JUN1979]|uniref:NAD(P)-dependent oxidoreductase n=1 Tax=Streptococcus sp. zg-JUN1979 TaxID=3391450 RepID=UPI0039A75A66